MLLATYFLVVRLKSYYFVYNVIVVIAFILASYHLFQILVNLNTITNYTALRTLAGKQNHIELAALILMSFTDYFKNNLYFKKHLKIIFYAVISTSVLFYFSRSMYIVFFLFFLSYNGYLYLSKKMFIGLFSVLIFASVSYFVLSNLDYKKNVTHTTDFAYKIYNSINELFGEVNLSKIKKDKTKLWEHWRSYEGAVAVDNVINSKNNITNTIFGMGFGSNINLKTQVKLDGNTYKEVPSIHNGYINIFYKTGLLGLLAYLLFLFSNYFFAHLQHFKEPHLRALFVGSIFYMVYNSFVITGFLRPGEFSLVIMAIALSLNKKMSYSDNLSFSENKIA